ncbi:MAG: 4-hydroxybenzoate octaprenyltransferase [Oceanidesulfovibrio sp.]
MGAIAKTRSLLRMVKIEHSVFALPFAYLGAFVSAGGWPGWRVFVLLTVAMVAVRSFAMAWNRLVDLPFDSQNPRTATRPLVTGEISVRETKIFLGATACVFILAAAGLNWLCLALAPLALIWSAFYSYTKRFTPMCHFALGSVLGLAPIAGWIAPRVSFSLPPVLFFLGVTFWVAGFDILYAMQDVEFDRKKGLNSVPAAFGVKAGLAIAALSHVNAAIFFLLGGWAAWLSWPYFVTWVVVAGVLYWEHKLIKPDDLSRINMAFFTLNGVISIVLFLGALASLG